MVRLKKITLLIVGLLALAGCQPSTPVRSFQVGEELAAYNFEEARTFEEGLYASAALRITDGVYRIELTRGDNELWWGQWGDTLSDVVVDVNVEQQSERNENAYGVGCRMAGAVGQTTALDPELAEIVEGDAAEEAAAEATEAATSEATETATEDSTAEADPTEEATEASAEVTDEATEQAADEAATEEATDEPDEEAIEAVETEQPEDDETEAANGNGYLFLIQGSGSFAIMRAQGRDLHPLVNWTQSDKINQGQATNALRAVCMGDYLAFYINGEFVADATDDTYSAGQVGLLASGATRLGVLVEFDDLIVSEAESE